MLKESMNAGDERREIEIKLAAPGVAWARRLLGRHGFRKQGSRLLQSDVVLDTARRRLQRAGALLRLRRSGTQAWLTYKGPASPGPHKNREELELALKGAAAAALEEVLARLGFRPTFRYEKYRTEFARPKEPGIVALDETPIGVYLELEGPPQWIDRTARRLGFQRGDYITATYAQLYLKHCRKTGRKPGDMLFNDSSDAPSPP